MQGDSDVRQTEIHRALVPEPSAYEVAMATEKLNRHKSPGIVQIPAELITAGGTTIRSSLTVWHSQDRAS